MTKTVISLNTKTELLTKLYNNFVDNGLDRTSMRDLCKGTGVSLGSLYYWFDDKEDLVIQTALFGIEKILEQFLETDFDSAKDLRELLGICTLKFQELKNHLRFIYQVALSPVYGERMRKECQGTIARLDSFVLDITKRFSLNASDFIPIVSCFLSIVVRDVVWDDEGALELQLKFLLKCIEGLE